MSKSNPFLSIIIVFCDKDVQYIPGLLSRIRENVKLSYEVILIDNRNSHETGLELLDNEHLYSKGFNAYQFEARRFSIQFCSGEYIWFVDADDDIFTVNDSLASLTSDFIVFNYALFNGKILELPYCHFRKKLLLNNKTRFQTYSRKQTFEKVKECRIWDIMGLTLWSKWIKRSIAVKAIKHIPENKVIIASEDIFYCSLFLSRSKNVTFVKDYLYKYNDYRSQGFSDNMNTERFSHIIKGRKESRELFRKYIPHYKLYETIENDIPYFIERALFCPPEDQMYCFRLMLKNFSMKEIKASLNSNWIQGFSDDKKKRLSSIIFKLEKEIVAS